MAYPGPYPPNRQRRPQPTDGRNNPLQPTDEPRQENLSNCCICLADMPIDEGLTCPRGHFICNHCLGSYFETRINIRNIQTHQLRLPCPVPGCEARSFAPIRAIAAHLPPATAGLILENLDKVLEVLALEREQRPVNEPEQRPVNEPEPPQPSAQSDIERRRLHIIDNIITLKHSICGMAFIDFNGCCAVECDICPPSRNAFCAICLASCGNDAHQHVATEHGNVFMDDLELRRHHNRRRQDQLVEYFRGPGANCDRGALLEALRGDLAGIGMNVEELRAVLPGVGGALVEEPHQEQKKAERRRRRWIIIVFVLFLIIVALSTTVGVVLSRRNGVTSGSSFVSTTMAATPTNTVVTATTSSSPISFGPVYKDVLMTYPSPLPQPSNEVRQWGPEQATGPPNTPIYGDTPTAWAPLLADDSYAWLLLDYQVPIQPARIDVYETYNPGAVVEIWVFPPGSNVSALNAGELFWSGPAQFNLSASMEIFQYYTNNSAIKYDDQFFTSRVLVVMNTTVPGYNEIDAVGLVDITMAVQWASGAAASSSIAGSDYFQHPDYKRR